MAETHDFDKSYYDRFYRNPKTRVHDRKDTHRLGGFICAYLRHLRIAPRRVLDLGCGLGFWREVLAEHYPRASYLGVEYSDYLCQSEGWTHGSVVDFSSARPFDLVICQGVLQYLPHRAAAKALANLATLCRGALYLEALTAEDWRQNCDRQRSDAKVHLRRADWYRQHLEQSFIAAGGGLYLRHGCDAVLYELEKLS